MGYKKEIKKEKTEEKKIQWHPAFASAMDLEFAENREDLISEREYNLNTQPLRVDLLLIKKIVVGKELGKESHLWLRALSGHMDKNEMMRLIQKTGNLKAKQDRESASSVLAVSTDANQKILEAMKGDKTMYEKLIEILQPEFLITLDSAKKKERDEGIKNTVTALRNMDIAEEKIQKQLIELYNLTPEEAKAYLKGR